MKIAHGMANLVTAGTVFFWIIEVLATTVGQTATGLPDIYLNRIRVDVSEDRPAAPAPINACTYP